MPTLEDAIEYIRMGNQEEGRLILEEILEDDENNEEVWLWLSSVVETDEDREICLENVLALNPDNRVAQKGLEAIRSGRFDANELFGDMLEGDEDEEEIEGTFLDDFVITDELDDELETPKAMKKSKPKAKKSSGLKINPRILILVGLVVVLILVLGAAGAAYFFLLDDGGGGGEPTLAPSAETSVPVATATPTETPTPAPTDTPTATFTPALQLPTAAPTNTPSPTSTRVVSPTPSN